MPVAMTLRIDQELKDQLVRLGGLKRTTVNKLINQALVQYVESESLVVQEELEASLQALKRYRESDPDFEKAIDQVASAELSTVDDSAQGVVDSPADKTTTTLVRNLLGA